MHHLKIPIKNRCWVVDGHIFTIIWMHKISNSLITANPIDSGREFNLITYIIQENCNQTPVQKFTRARRDVQYVLRITYFRFA